MSKIAATAFARAGLLGNPSDGFHGKTISFVIRNFWAEVRLRPSRKLSIGTDWEAEHQFDSIQALSERVVERGFYGGGRLIKAAIHRFFRFVSTEFELHRQNFEITYTTNIPRQVGLAGSSAIVVATMRALCKWFDVSIPPHLLASLSLAAESDLGIPAGLQDRVIQAMEGLVYMDFSASAMSCEREMAYGNYEPLDPALLSNIYIAYAASGQPTEILHSDLRRRFDANEPSVIAAMKKLAAITDLGKEAILNQDTFRLGELINQNFDVRRSICALHTHHVEMVEAARNVGASAKYCGSGGAIVGLYESDEMMAKLRDALGSLNCRIILPLIAGT
jgi:glucuronokinase